MPEPVPPPYLPCRHAYAYCELYLAAPPEGDPESSFDLMRKHRIGVGRATELIAGIAAEPGCKFESEAARVRILAEMGTPAFRTYLAARLGLM